MVFCINYKYVSVFVVYFAIRFSKKVNIIALYMQIRLNVPIYTTLYQELDDNIVIFYNDIFEICYTVYIDLCEYTVCIHVKLKIKLTLLLFA